MTGECHRRVFRRDPAMADIKADGESNAGSGQSFGQMRRLAIAQLPLISLSRTGPRGHKSRQ